MITPLGLSVLMAGILLYAWSWHSEPPRGGDGEAHRSSSKHPKDLPGKAATQHQE